MWDWFSSISDCSPYFISPISTDFFSLLCSHKGGLAMSRSEKRNSFGKSRWERMCTLSGEQWYAENKEIKGMVKVFNIGSRAETKLKFSNSKSKSKSKLASQNFRSRSRSSLKNPRSFDFRSRSRNFVSALVRMFE